MRSIRAIPPPLKKATTLMILCWIVWLIDQSVKKFKLIRKWITFIVLEALNKLIELARSRGVLNGIAVGNNGNQTELTHLFFTDDAFLFCQPNVSNLLSMRCILLCFQAVSGLKINMDKSELIEIGNAPSIPLAGVLGCKTSTLLIKYLGTPLGAKHKDGGCWDWIIDMFQKRLAN